jgi:hypothetical protein
MHRRALIIALFAASSAAAASPTVTVETLAGPPRTGHIKSWSLDAGLALDAEVDAKPIKSTDLSRVTNPAATERPNPGDWTFLTTDGQRILGRIESGDENHITIRHATLGALVVPIESTAAIIASATSAPRLAPGESDRVVLANGDVATGIIREITREKLRVADSASENEREIDTTLLQRADFANPSTQPAAELAAILRLTDGSTLRASELNWRDDSIDVVLLGRQRARLDPEVVRAIEIVGGPRGWLSDLEPAAFEHKPILGPRLPLGRDANALGKPLQFNGRRYDRGLGLHSAQRIEYALDRRFKRLRAIVALDESAGPLADATLRISVDGRELARMEHLRAGQAPQQLDVDLANADRLLIELDSANNADIQDRLDLLDASLLRN